MHTHTRDHSARLVLLCAKFVRHSYDWSLKRIEKKTHKNNKWGKTISYMYWLNCELFWHHTHTHTCTWRYIDFLCCRYSTVQSQLLNMSAENSKKL